VSSVIFNELVEYAQENGIERDEQGINYGENQIKTLLKAQIVRNLYDEEGFYKIYLTIDNVYEKALESFEMNFTELRYKQ
jgi:carboxyl-terminal processing protease